MGQLCSVHCCPLRWFCNTGATPCALAHFAQVERLERRINALEDAVEAAGLDVHSVARAAQEEAIFVGRICCDAGEAGQQARGGHGVVAMELGQCHLQCSPACECPVEGSAVCYTSPSCLFFW